MCTDIVGGSPAPQFNAAFTLDNAALSFGSSTQSLSTGVGVRLAVRVRSAGRVQALDPGVGRGAKNRHKAPWFNTVSATAEHAGVVHLKLVPNAVGRKQLSHKQTIHVLVRVSFAPKGAQPSVHTISITWHGK